MHDGRMAMSPGAASELARELEAHRQLRASRLDVAPEKVERELARLVLTLVELLRRLLEREALRRMDTGTLTDEEVERLGLAFFNLEMKIQELKEYFGLSDEELNLNLGPLGNLM